MIKKKILIVYDPIRFPLGGGERVLLQLTKSLRPTTVVIPFALNHPNIRSYLEKLRRYTQVKTTLLPNISVFYKLMQSRIASIYQKIDTESYEIVIPYTASLAHIVKKHPNQRKIVYFNTPSRLLWHLPSSRSWLHTLIPSLIKEYSSENLRALDIKGIAESDQIYTISYNVRMRVLTFYNRKARVVYPPVGKIRMEQGKEKTDQILKNFGLKKYEYFVHISRLEGYKNIQLLLTTYKDYNPPFKTLIIGGGQKLKGLPQNLLYTGYLSETVKNTLLAYAAASLSLNDEDLGLNKVESIILQTPVIACKSISAYEILKDKGGYILPTCSKDALYHALEKYYKSPTRVPLTHTKKLQKTFSFSRFKKDVSQWLK